MKKEMKYDPEDIESLLMHKEFSELYPEEREFVLRHIESPAEYASLRKTLHEVIEAGKGDKWLVPEPEIREHLLAQFAKEDRRGFAIWLNSLFAAPQVTWYRKPAFQLAFGATAILIVAGILYFRRPADQVELIAENNPGTESVNEPATDKIADLTPPKVDEKLIAENLNAPEPNGIPPAPAPVSEQILFTTIEVNDEVAENVQQPVFDSDMSNQVDSEESTLSDSAPEVEATAPATTSGYVSAKANKAEADAYKYAEPEVKEKLGVNTTTEGSLKKGVDLMKQDQSLNNSVRMSEMPDLFSILYTAP